MYLNRRTAPPPSHVSRLASEIASTARQCAQDFREAHLDVYAPAGRRDTVNIARTNVSDTTANTVAQNESRLLGLALGAKKLERVLEDLRSAHGLVTRGLDGDKAVKQGSSWTVRDMDEASARARDKKRGSR